MASDRVENSAQRATDEYELGQLKHACYRSLVPSLFLGSFSMLICLIVIGTIGYEALTSLERPEEASLLLPWWKTGLALGVALLFLLLSIWGMLRAYRNRRLCVLIYERGIVEEGQERSLVLRWEEIKYLRHSKTSSTQNSASTDLYAIEGDRQRQITFSSNLERHATLFREVTEQTLPYLLTRARENYRVGQAVDFAAVTVQRAGIKLRRNGEVLSWQEFDSLEVHPTGNTVIRRKDKKLAWFDGPLPNTEVFQHLVREIRAGQLATS
jgi:hypothetical protein